ncbi:MAG: glycoside hydrolase family 13 protein [Treponema sp.]|jgi:neopullulanase|nr:glycoside hydrolase family 13 protein [Treponema sp.]
MDAGFPQVYHQACLPYCYYDKYSRKVILRLVLSGEADAVSLIYGDPFCCTRTGKTYRWQYQETALEKQLSGEAAGPAVWQAALELPLRRRLKYGFRIKAGPGDYYFSENGLEPYTLERAVKNYNQFFFPFIHEVDAPSAPEWVQDTVWYQIFPERFCNGDPSLSPPGTADWERGKPETANFFGGDLPGIRQKLGYLRDLGITGIFLNPVFKAPSNHKYDTEDYFTIDEHFGTLEDLKGLVEDAHALGIRVILDGVFNHIGERHPFWQDVLKNQEKSVYRNYFHIHSFPVKDRYSNPEKIPFDAFAMSSRMPKWNTENPQARRYLLDAAVYWIRECGIDGWRLDVSDEVSFDFWRAFAGEVRAAKQDLYILGEMWHDASNWLNPGYFNAVMNYPAGFAIADFFLRKTIGPGEFTRRIFQTLGRYSDLHNRLAFNLLDSHDTPRALTLAGGDKPALRNAFTLLFLLPGSPCLYYGTEMGLTGSGDPECRKPMIWGENRRDRELLSFFRDLVAFRKKHIALINSCTMRYEAENGVSRWIIGGGENTLRAVYTGENPVEAAGEAGQYVFSAAPLNNGEIPPFTLAVFHNCCPKTSDLGQQSYLREDMIFDRSVMSSLH